jgi:N,N'-diacetyllegionaminate synthase
MPHTIIIAEAGVNHNGDIGIAKQLIDAAKSAGADYVKFQTFRTEELVSQSASMADYQKQNTGKETSQFEMLRALELSEADHHTLVEHCRNTGIRFFSTAFDPASLDFLNSLGIALFKIPSGEITNYPYLKKVAGFGKPVILSTGMSDMDEIAAAVDVLLANGVKRNDLTILHCTTEYPAPFGEVNLRAMQTIRDRFNVNVGYSDHTKGIEIPVAAVALGATVIEKHFTLDRNMKGPDHRASLEPAELKAMVEAIRNTEQALGDGNKVASLSEIKNKAVARKSVHVRSALPAGHVISEGDLAARRPGDGISPMDIPRLTGRKIRTGVNAGHKLTWEDIE